jgi:hypothetical protein
MTTQTTKQGGIKTAFKNFTVSAVYIGNKSASWANDNWYNSRVTVYNRETKKRTMFDFWGSLMNPELRTRYDLLNAFYCFVSDAVSGNQSFHDFCREYGYDEDSIKARNTWLACKKSLEKAKRVLDTDIYDVCNELSEITA